MTVVVQVGTTVNNSITSKVVTDLKTLKVMATVLKLKHNIHLKLLEIFCNNQLRHASATVRLLLSRTTITTRNGFFLENESLSQMLFLVGKITHM